MKWLTNASLLVTSTLAMSACTDGKGWIYENIYDIREEQQVPGSRVRPSLNPDVKNTAVPTTRFAPTAQQAAPAVAAQQTATAAPQWEGGRAPVSAEGSPYEFYEQNQQTRPIDDIAEFFGGVFGDDTAVPQKPAVSDGRAPVSIQNPHAPASLHSADAMARKPIPGNPENAVPFRPVTEASMEVPSKDAPAAISQDTNFFSAPVEAKPMVVPAAKSASKPVKKPSANMMPSSFDAQLRAKYDAPAEPVMTEEVISQPQVIAQATAAPDELIVSAPAPAKAAAPKGEEGWFERNVSGVTSMFEARPQDPSIDLQAPYPALSNVPQRPQEFDAVRAQQQDTVQDLRTDNVLAKEQKFALDSEPSSLDAQPLVPTEEIISDVQQDTSVPWWDSIEPRQAASENVIPEAPAEPVFFTQKPAPIEQAIPVAAPRQIAPVLVAPNAAPVLAPALPTLSAAPAPVAPVTATAPTVAPSQGLPSADILRTVRTIPQSRYKDRR